ncbi:hypothetical protein ElyMa_002924700 [Elysia marginata]|uniref:LEM domain-containing protein n=1 Tax=Elysia marginata TaxID=1093978 RepID=A0AAV4I4V8_9GAST|nr:hypothetical protein ElyMa_002924700 [Elysia marginata]
MIRFITISYDSKWPKNKRWKVIRGSAKFCGSVSLALGPLSARLAPATVLIWCENRSKTPLETAARKTKVRGGNIANWLILPFQCFNIGECCLTHLNALYLCLIKLSPYTSVINNIGVSKRGTVGHSPERPSGHCPCLVLFNIHCIKHRQDMTEAAFLDTVSDLMKNYSDNQLKGLLVKHGLDKLPFTVQTKSALVKKLAKKMTGFDGIASNSSYASRIIIHNSFQDVMKTMKENKGRNPRMLSFNSREKAEEFANTHTAGEVCEGATIKSVYPQV